MRGEKHGVMRLWVWRWHCLGNYGMKYSWTKLRDVIWGLNLGNGSTNSDQTTWLLAEIVSTLLSLSLYSFLLLYYPWYFFPSNLPYLLYSLHCSVDLYMYFFAIIVTSIISILLLIIFLVPYSVLFLFFFSCLFLCFHSPSKLSIYFLSLNLLLFILVCMNAY